VGYEMDMKNKAIKYFKFP